jgi:low affinity Fe/Cu permease
MADEMPHAHERRTRFDRFAERATRVASGAPFFAACMLFVVLWLPTLVLMDVEGSQILVQTVTAIFTFLLVALLQNSQERNEEAVNRKLNAIAQAVADLMRERTGNDKDLHDNIEQLTDTVGLEDRTSTDGKSRDGRGGRDKDKDIDKDKDDDADEGEVTARSR